jgi:hypothetical protein
VKTSGVQKTNTKLLEFGLETDAKDTARYVCVLLLN